MMRRTRKEKHEAVLQVRNDRRARIDRLYSRTSIGKKFDEVQASKRGRVFVLFSHMVSEYIARNMKGALRQFLF